MANQKITALTAATSVVDADLFAVVKDVSTTPVTKSSTGTLVKAWLKTYFDPLYKLPVGQMRNGKITPTVASNDLILTLKTAAGTDPSASDPVDVNINGTMRQVTAALSVTKADATNWANLGSAELATKETDLFCYLIWNTNLAPDAVDILWSRIPGGRVYGDFSSTTTNEKHAAINATAPAATDDCVCVGRFAATLSAGAGYTWTVPTFTNANLIQHPIFETRWLTWVPTFTGYSSNPTTVRYQYKIAYDRINFEMDEGAVGVSNLTTKTYTLPFASGLSGTGLNIFPVPILQDNGTLAAAGYGQLIGTNSTVSFFKSAGAGWTASGNCRILNTSGSYQI